MPVLRQCLAESNRLQCGSQHESCGQLHAAQDAQRVFGETFRHVAQHVRIKVGPAVEGIAEFQGIWVPGHGVHGEIAPRQRLVDVHVGVGLPQQSLGGFVVGEHAGGNGNIDGQAPQLEHAKGLPD